MIANYDIVICFSKEDNLPLEGSDRGWVTNFHKFLSTLIGQIMRRPAKILMLDEDNRSIDAFLDAPVLITIISRDFLKQEWLIEGTKAFGKINNAAEDSVYDGINRLFKVIKHPVDNLDDVLSEYAAIIPFEVYRVDPLTGQAMEFRRFFGNDAERNYWMKLVDMAYDIYHILQRVDHMNTSSSTNAAIPRDRTVYLASTGVDMIIQRDIVKRELIRHGYKVLPDRTLPKEVSALERQIKRDLDKCRLSIHLVGEDYGYRPKGAERSVVDIQNHLASNHNYDINEQKQENSNPLQFNRLIWIPPDLKNISERQQIFIEDLKTDAAALDEAEVLSISLQELKTIIQEELVTGGRFKRDKSPAITTQVAEDTELSQVYLIYDRLDEDKGKEIAARLHNQGVKVLMPIFDADLVDMRYLHQENLRKCDGSFIYCGTTTSDWLITKIQDTLKAPGFGREEPIRSKAIFLESEGEMELDQDFIAQSRTIILNANGKKDNELFDPFISKLIG